VFGDIATRHTQGLSGSGKAQALRDLNKNLNGA
jgi:hypothetical protein